MFPPLFCLSVFAVLHDILVSLAVLLDLQSPPLILSHDLLSRQTDLSVPVLLVLADLLVSESFLKVNQIKFRLDLILILRVFFPDLGDLLQLARAPLLVLLADGRLLVYPLDPVLELLNLAFGVLTGSGQPGHLSPLELGFPPGFGFSRS